LILSKGVDAEKGMLDRQAGPKYKIPAPVVGRMVIEANRFIFFFTYFLLWCEWGSVNYPPTPGPICGVCQKQTGPLTGITIRKSLCQRVSLGTFESSFARQLWITETISAKFILLNFPTPARLYSKKRLPCLITLVLFFFQITDHSTLTR
jgi:hypothetical protein